ncbi:hypothetical protein BV372_29330 [Nostoc sp. T09]|uniref:hypothetical protein n=1 Tax=Nostoc sp. T09 TaxID=1932621 RepID=UPI000A376AC3|nr:hypothetical protein [Nostoc sp. T09]OUL24048.1 hypothetical protein BV372_29330 [Nostoc sp. T09]
MTIGHGAWGGGGKRSLYQTIRVFQTINDPKPVIANEAKLNEAIAEFEIASLRDATRTLHSVSLAMTIGHFFTWSTLKRSQISIMPTL